MNGALRGLAIGLALFGTSVSAQSPAPIQARQQIAAMEIALENAVMQGTFMLNKRLQSSDNDNMVTIAGLTRARGFRLDDYGVVFDVEFPSMRRSVVWSIQQLERNANASTGGSRAAIAAAEAQLTLRPREIYQTEISNALVSAVVDYRGSLGVGANEWLTVAARESVFDRRFVGDPNDTAITIIVRIKGSDLQALREGTVSREDGLKRVVVKHY